MCVQGREEEFVAFVFDKYDVPYERMVQYRAPQGDEVIEKEPEASASLEESGTDMSKDNESGKEADTGAAADALDNSSTEKEPGDGRRSNAQSPSPTQSGRSQQQKATVREGVRCIFSQHRPVVQ